MSAVTWYVVHSRPREEALAAENLLRQDFEVCLPRLRVPKLRRGRWRDTVEPMFPRYLFAGVPAGGSVAPVRSSRGVAALVRFGERFATVTEELVSALQAQADAEGIASCRPTPFEPGQTVRVIAGPFMDLTGIYTEPSGDGRVRILMSVLGTQAMVNIDAGLLVPSHRSAAVSMADGSAVASISVASSVLLSTQGSHQ